MMSRIARVLACAALAVAPGLLASCGSSTTEATNPVIAIQLSGSTAAVTQGGTQNFTVTLTRTAFTGDVALSASGLPAGVTATFNPATLSGNTLSSTVTLTATADAAPSTNTTVTVHATGTGVTEATGTIGVTVNVAGSYSLGMSPGTVNVAAGASTSSTINITRAGGFNGAVALTVTGAPTGVTATITPASVSVGTNSATLNIVTTGSAAVAQSTLTIHGNSAGTTEQTTTLAVNVTPASGASLALSPASVNLDQGGAVVDTITITRTGGFSGAVALTATGVPTGVTASFSDANPTGNTSVMTLSAASNATTGAATVIVHANATGISEATASLGTTVNAPSTTSISLNQNCIGDHGAPLYFAFRNQNASTWTVVTASGGNYVFNATSHFQVAAVTPNSNGGTDTFFGFLTTAAMAPQNGVACAARFGNIGVTGSVANTNTSGVQISAPNSGTFASAGSPNFSLSNLPSTGYDLVAALNTGSNGGMVPTSIILRRNVVSANGDVLPVLDFGTAEPFAPVTASLTVTGIGADTAQTFGQISTSMGTNGELFGAATSGSATIYGLPVAKLITGDIHQIYVQAQPMGANPTQSRGAIVFQHAIANASVALGPYMSTPTVSIASSTPYVMMRVQAPLQAQYNMGMQAEFKQGTHRVQMMALADYFVGMTSWDFTMPDLSSASGWTNSWGLQTGQATNWQLQVFGGSLGDFIGNGTDGQTQYFASLQSSINTSPAPSLSPANTGMFGTKFVRPRRIRSR